jgi:protein-tyrosine phosphatase
MENFSRSLNLTGATNFRDLGGYVGQEGRSVRWRRLFRSDHLAALTPTDLAQLASLGLTRVCDFRGEAEREPFACILPNVAVHSLAIEPTVVQRMKEILDAGQSLTAGDTVLLMKQTYRAFVTDNSPRFAALFAHLLESDAPLVFHCTAGKDRTGFAAALILLALGVPRAVVMQDYLLTNQLFRMPRPSSELASREVLDVLWRVQEGFLEAAFSAVEEDFGDLTSYLQQALGVGAGERERLVSLYLENPRA